MAPHPCNIQVSLVIEQKNIDKTFLGFPFLLTRWDWDDFISDGFNLDFFVAKWIYLCWWGAKFGDFHLVFVFSGDFVTFHHLLTVVYPDYPEVETTEDYIEARFESLHMTVIAP